MRSFGNGSVNKIRHDLMSILIGLFRDHYITNKCKKSDTMC